MNSEDSSNKGKNECVGPQTLVFFFLKYTHTHKSVIVFILVKMKMVKICIHFLYPNSHFSILKKKIEYK